MKALFPSSMIVLYFIFILAGKRAFTRNCYLKKNCIHFSRSDKKSWRRKQVLERYYSFDALAKLSKKTKDRCLSFLRGFSELLFSTAYWTMEHSPQVPCVPLNRSLLPFTIGTMQLPCPWSWNSKGWDDVWGYYHSLGRSGWFQNLVAVVVVPIFNLFKICWQWIKNVCCGSYWLRTIMKV